MVFKRIFNKYFRHHLIFRQFTKFCIVGSIAALINFSIYYSFTEWLGYWYIISGVLGFIISAIFNFSANKFWTFKNRKKGKEIFYQAIKFTLVVIFGLLINTVILYSLTDGGGFDYRLSWVFATGVVIFWNFSFNRFWTFRAKNSLA